MSNSVLFDHIFESLNEMQLYDNELDQAKNHFVEYTIDEWNSFLGLTKDKRPDIYNLINQFVLFSGINIEELLSYVKLKKQHNN